jgi:hypothetical protein
VLKRWAEAFRLASGDRRVLGSRDCFHTEKRALGRAQMPDAEENGCVEGGRSSVEC